MSNPLLIDYRIAMSAPRSVIALLVLVTLVIMLACGACGTARPTLSGQIVNSMQRDPAKPVEGVVVTVQGAKLLRPNDQSARFGALQPGDVIEPWPQVVASTTSDSEGKFSIPGAHGTIFGLSYSVYRVRFHRDDFRDAVFDFYYQQNGSIVPFYLEGKSLGPIPLRPHWADPPSTQPTAPVDVIYR